MRLYTATIVCRLDAEGEPHFSLDIDVEDGGVPGGVVLETLPGAMHSIARQLEANSVPVEVVER